MKNVLLVDDDSVFNFLNTRTLERIGIASDIQTALNGEQALDLFNGYYQGAGTLPDVVLLDLNMPVMNGFEFLEAFHLLNLPNKQQVKIIIVSSSQDERDVKRAQALGADGYLAKPITEKTLGEALAS